MKIEIVIVWVLLFALTIVSAYVSLSSFIYTNEVILGLMVIKFILVAFYFMDLKKAHVFWKSSILIFLTIIIVFTSFIINQ